MWRGTVVELQMTRLPNGQLQFKSVLPKPNQRIRTALWQDTYKAALNNCQLLYLYWLLETTVLGILKRTRSMVPSEAVSQQKALRCTYGCYKHPIDLILYLKPSLPPVCVSVCAVFHWLWPRAAVVQYASPTVPPKCKVPNDHVNMTPLGSVSVAMSTLTVSCHVEMHIVQAAVTHRFIYTWLTKDLASSKDLTWALRPVGKKCEM